MELKDKIVVITGSSSGIGKATAIAFAKEGAKVVINCHVNKEGGEEVLKEVTKYSEGMLVKADVSKADEVDSLFTSTVAKFGTIDILINNAANPTEKVSFFEATQSDLLDLLNANVVSAMLCSQKATEVMKKNGSGKIMFTSSIKGWEHGGGSVGYAVSKAAINSLTRTLAKQVAPNILVNAVAPGYVKTRVYDNMPQEKIDKWLNGTYLKKWVDIEDVANTFIFLAKNDSMTGQIIYVDAGFTLK
jgi:3-oxoacyl-[acyl-carrier protein] reductase